MKRGLQGRYKTISTIGEKVKAFVPNPLPPTPPIEWTPSLRGKFDDALLALGRLDSAANILPDMPLFLYMYVRKEAVLSSMIEGTQSSLSDLLLFEMDRQPGVPLVDVQEVSNHVAALNEGLRLLADGLPLSLRLLREVHAVLLGKGRGSGMTPGEFRRSQNWLGGGRPGNAMFVPPPPEDVLDCMSKLELFLHDKPEPTPALLKAALAHAQFETIHPFLDGNGRLGRLLITLILCEQKVLSQPILYPSLHFKTHRRRYYESLNQVRESGDWEAWLDFFAEAVKGAAEQAITAAGRLHALAAGDQGGISGLGRAAGSTEKIHRALLGRPIATPGWLAKATGLAPATVNKSLAHLQRLGVVRELTGRKRDRLFSYEQYVKMLDEGTEQSG
jgi:Fic family protein